MGWLKIDDGFEEHEKVVQLSDAAHRLWCRAACWCRKPENARTNGFVPWRIVVDLCKGSTQRARALAKELVEARGEPCFRHEHGLWEPMDGGWQFHDWEQFCWRETPSKAWSRAECRAVYDRDGGVCRYCGSVGEPTIDHVVPRCQGGGDGADNLVVACRSCNSRKGGRTPREAGMVLQ